MRKVLAHLVLSALFVGVFVGVFSLTSGVARSLVEPLLLVNLQFSATTLLIVVWATMFAVGTAVLLAMLAVVLARAWVNTLRQNGWALAVPLLLVASVSASAQSSGIRHVTASDQNLITLNTKVRFTTMIVLPEGDEILDVICGDRDFWVITATANIAHVKPAKEKAATNLNLVTAGGAIYSFLLQEGSTPLPDFNLFVHRDTSTSGKPTTTPKFYPASALAELQAELVEARAARVDGQKMADARVAQATAQYPTTMQFPYRRLPQRKPFWIVSMYHDGNFTYVKTRARELPIIYELKDGKPAVVNFQTPRPDTYVIPKVLERGYFQLGKEKLDFQAVE